MSARVLQFPQSRQSVIATTAREIDEHQEAVRIARLIKKSERGAAMALCLAIVQTMEPEHLARLEAALSGANTADTDVETALAVVRYVSASPAQQSRIGFALDRMDGKERPL